MLSVRALKRLHISVSFDLADGECVALQGPSGVGKTLLLRSIADLDPNEGVVKLDGTLREAMPAPAWRKRVTYLATEPGWWSDIVQDHFSGWDDALPLVTRLGLPCSCGPRPVQRLSTGERQRLVLVGYVLTFLIAAVSLLWTASQPSSWFSSHHGKSSHGKSGAYQVFGATAWGPDARCSRPVPLRFFRL